MSNVPPEDKGSMHLVVVMSMTEEDAQIAFSNACAVVEDTMTCLDKVEWKRADGLLIFQGQTSHPLSFVTSKLYSDPVTKNRVRDINYSTPSWHTHRSRQ